MVDLYSLMFLVPALDAILMFPAAVLVLIGLWAFCALLFALAPA